LRLLPVLVIRVTDENGGRGAGVRGINLLGWDAVGASMCFGGEMSVAASVDGTTITPGTWARHLGFSYSTRRNTLYDFASARRRLMRASVETGSIPSDWRRCRRR
jgi:hypothetical protein